MNVSLTVLSSISCIFDVELFTYVKEQKAVLEFFVPREKRSFFLQQIFYARNVQRWNDWVLIDGRIRED